jgi:uncharacterized protein (DUF1778 family)
MNCTHCGEPWVTHGTACKQPENIINENVIYITHNDYNELYKAVSESEKANKKVQDLFKKYQTYNH